MKRVSIRWTLVILDTLIYALACLLMLVVYPSTIDILTLADAFVVSLTGAVCVMGARFVLDVYRQIWRYWSAQAYIRLIAADTVGGILFILVRALHWMPKATFPRIASLVCISLLGALTLRIIYIYLYQCQYKSKPMRLLQRILNSVAGLKLGTDAALNRNRIRIAIVGAGSVGVMLAEELTRNPRAAYEPVCFIDIDGGKIGRMINGIKVLSEVEADEQRMSELGVQEVVLALPQMDTEKKKTLYSLYKHMGRKVKVYDYPTIQSAEGGKRQMREFRIEELLFRQTVSMIDAQTSAYYKGRTVMITGGGGSIGSELCRQIAKMEPKRLIILDVYENGAYDVQQELKFAYGDRLDLAVEILSVCDRSELEKIFDRHRPEIVLHAAAHKHVPLMERNVCEAVKNNVFGTNNVVEVCRQFGVKRFIMVSTDKAVNPTNVMGATKRLCEMLVLSQDEKKDDCVYSCTRFGNVLGSAGSVVPLFQRQIQNGGPVTLTDKRIIRYFMTIQEASQLVLQSGAMAQDGELFVLDMGKPVKILELAESMIRLMGYEPYKDIDIVETGLRPGEKLYEELLIKDENLSKTKNKLIFIERDKRHSRSEINEKLELLRKAVENNDDDAMRDALKQAVPTFHAPEEVNESATQANEMRMAAS